MQQINLYTTEFHPQRQWLTPQHCAQLWGAVLALGLLIACGLAWRSHNLRSEVAALQAQLQTEQAALTAAQTLLAARVPSPTLTTELQRRNAEAAAKTELLAALETGILSGSQGYTPILTSLARNTLDDLWLTAIEIVDGDVNLTGATHNADLVPIYIDKIVGAVGFGPRGYESLDIKAGENGVLTFALRSRRNINNVAASQ